MRRPLVDEINQSSTRQRHQNSDAWKGECPLTSLSSSVCDFDKQARAPHIALEVRVAMHFHQHEAAVSDARCCQSGGDLDVPTSVGIVLNRRLGEILSRKASSPPAAETAVASRSYRCAVHDKAQEACLTECSFEIKHQF